MLSFFWSRNSLLRSFYLIDSYYINFSHWILIKCFNICFLTDCLWTAWLNVGLSCISISIGSMFSMWWVFEISASQISAANHRKKKEILCLVVKMLKNDCCQQLLAHCWGVFQCHVIYALRTTNEIPLTSAVFVWSQKEVSLWKIIIAVPPWWCQSYF